MLLILEYHSDFPISQTNVSIEIDNTAVDYNLTDSNITFDWEPDFGIHFLKIHNQNPATLKIVDLFYNSDSLRHLLYLAYLNKDGEKVDSTWVKQDDGALTIPIGYPLGWWYSICSRKFNNGDIGNDLYKKYQVFYPESIEIPKSYSTFMQEFFKYDFDFTVIPKEDITNPLHSLTVPYVAVDLEYDEELLFKEFDSKQDLLFNGNYSPDQKKYNAQWKLSMCVHMSLENQTNVNGWKETFIYEPDDFPLLYRLLDQISNLGDVHIYHCFIGAVDPGTRVDPHKDDINHSAAELGYDVTGLCQMFIPIGWKEGNYYKFGSVGLIDYSHGPTISNNANYIHASINESSSTRYTIGIYCKFTGNNILHGK
jgi:hypothetical protein